MASTVALGPLLLAYGWQLWSDPVSRLPLLIAVIGAAVLSCKRRNGIEKSGTPPRVAIVSALILIAAGFVGSPALGFLAWLTILALNAFASGGLQGVSTFAPLLLLGVMLVRLPFDLGHDFLSGLQTAAAKSADKLLDLRGVFHVLQGSVVSVSERRLLIVEANLGGQLLFAALAATALLMGLLKRPLWQSVVVLVSIPLWTVLANGARIAVVSLLVDQNRLTADGGALHYVFWTAAFVSSVLLALSLAELLQLIAAFVRRSAAVANEQTIVRRPAPAWTSKLIVASAVLSLVLQSVGWIQWASKVSATSASIEPDLGANPRGALAESFGEFQRGEFRSQTKDRFEVSRTFSKSWDYKAGSSLASFVVDYPARDWNETTALLRSTGWIIGRRDARDVEIGGRTATVVELEVTRPSSSRVGRLWLALVDRTWIPAPPPDFALVKRVFDRPTPAEIVRAVRSDSDERGPYVRLQLFVDRAAPLDEASRSAADAFFIDSCRRMFDIQTKAEAVR